MRILCLIIMCLMLNGCFAYHKITTLKMKGGKIRVPIGSVAPIEGEDIDAVLVRQVWLTAEPKKKIPPLSNIEVKNKGKADNQDDSIIIQK